MTTSQALCRSHSGISTRILTNLPVELVSEILVHAVQPSSDTRISHFTLHALLCTSRFIHNLVQSIPRIFTQLTISFPSTSSTGEILRLALNVDRFFSKSGPFIPLQISVDASRSSSAFDVFLSLVILNPRYQSRWERLHFQGLPLHSGFSTLLHSLHTQPWPVLKSLTLEANQEDSSLTPLGCGLPDCVGRGLQLNAPNMKHLVLNLRTTVNSVFPVASGSVAGMWANLRSLEMDTYTTSREMLAILAATPFLTSCDIRLHGDMFDADVQLPLSGKIILNDLKWLTVRTAPHLNIFSSLTTSNLRGLYIDMMDEEDVIDPSSVDPSVKTLASFLESSCSQSLTHLKLVSCPLSDLAIEHVLERTPFLRELRIWWGPTGLFFDGLAVVRHGDLILSDWQCDAGIHCAGGRECYGTHKNLVIPSLAPRLQLLEFVVSPTGVVDRLYQRFCRTIRTRRCAFASQFGSGHKIESRPEYSSWLDPVTVYVASQEDDAHGRCFDNEIGQDPEDGGQ